MALNGNTLGDQMLQAIDALSDSSKTDRQAIFRALGGAIVSHIKTNGVVNSGIAVQVSPSSGTGTTTGTGTIT